MQNYNVVLTSEVSKSYRCTRAANSLDIDQQKKSKHTLSVSADLDKPYNIGLIIGASGSGKTTLAKKIFGEDCFKAILDEDKTILDQMPPDYDYETCAKILSGVGLTQVVCWIRPVKTLSNGQKSRAEAALLMCREELTVIDEWTSVVDRTVAKAMSHCIQKHARRENKKIILLSCHYDVVDWLNPDWIIDCNKQEYIDRRSLRQDFKRSEQLQFDVRKVGRETWQYFSKYHYLSERLSGGYIENFGLFHDKNQIGFISYANYVPHFDKRKKKMMHFNRIVIHPDYSGLGLGILFLNQTAALMYKNGYDVRGKFSSIPMYKSCIKSAHWVFNGTKTKLGQTKLSSSIKRRTGYRENIKTFHFTYRPI